MNVLPFGAYGFSIAVYVIGIMLSIAGISLGIGYAANKRSLKEFGKEEIYQSVINGVLVSYCYLIWSFCICNMYSLCLQIVTGIIGIIARRIGRFSVWINE